mgnify:CR=1 FL=1
MASRTPGENRTAHIELLEELRAAREEVAAGRQAYVVCPLVADSEKLRAKAAGVEAERLRAEQRRIAVRAAQLRARRLRPPASAGRSSEAPPRPAPAARSRPSSRVLPP